MTDNRQNETKLSDADLTALFDAARDRPEPIPGERSAPFDAVPSAALMQAILADAEALQPRPAGPVGAAPRASRMVELLDSLGGWFGVGGLATACAAGVMIGVGAPELVTDWASYLNGSSTFVDASSGFNDLLEEG